MVGLPYRTVLMQNLNFMAISALLRYGHHGALTFKDSPVKRLQ